MDTQVPAAADVESTLASRMARVRNQMVNVGADALVLSVGADLPYLTGYRAMPLERLTALVVTRENPPVLIVPVLEAPRVSPHPRVFVVETWLETQDPVALVAAALGNSRTVAVGDTMWARFLVELLALRPELELMRSREVMSPLRAVKDPMEIDALGRAAAAADRVGLALQRGDIPLVGRTEAEVSAELGQRLLREGHERVNFAIVAAGENAASPHHHPGDRIIEPGEVVLCDFGGTMNGYCSDITRCVFTGEPPSEFADMYSLLLEAQQTAVASVRPGVSCESVDRVAREIITAGGHGPHFIHRTGHGIGMEEHEDPYIVEGNSEPLVEGHSFSIEPGIYVPGRWGARLEDIVVVSSDGVEPLNSIDHELVVVES